MNTHVLLVPFDKLERGNEDEIFLRGDALRGGVLRRHIGRIVYVEIAFFEGRQAVFFYNLRRNDAVYLRLLKGLLYGVPHDLLRQGTLERIHGHDSL